nr:hypothetical protein [Tanacetum cinerariifolium]
EREYGVGIQNMTNYVGYELGNIIAEVNVEKNLVVIETVVNIKGIDEEEGRMIKEIVQNAEIALDVETQGRTNDDEMFSVDDLAGEEVVMETTIGVKDSAAPKKDVTEDDIIMAQALAALNSTKPKVVQSQIPTVSLSKDKGKAKMIEPEVPIKKKDQMRIDEEYARNLQTKEQETERLSRSQQHEGSNNSWDNMQAMMVADSLLVEKLQAREREEFSEVQKAR